MRLLSLMLSGLALLGCSTLEERHAALMETIEREVVLPEGAAPIEKYARYYAEDHDGRLVGVWTAFDLTALDDREIGTRQWMHDVRKLPDIRDGGCIVVNVIFNPATDRIEQVSCNGWA